MTPDVLPGVPPLTVTVFTDFACPYSYLTEALLWELRPESVSLRFRAFELYPEPEQPVVPAWTSEERDAILHLARGYGAEISEPPLAVRTRKAHEAVAFARERGVEIPLRKALYEAYWREGLDIGRIDVIRELAPAAGLDPDDLRIALDIDRYTETVIADRNLAGRLRIPGTPTIFLGTGPSAGVLVGARPAGELRDALHAALSRPDEA